MRTMLIVGLLATLAGCKAVPVLNPDGTPQIDPATGEPVVTHEYDGEAAGGAVQAVSGFLPPPFNLIASGVGGIMVGVAGQRVAGKRDPAKAEPAA